MCTDIVALNMHSIKTHIDATLINSIQLRTISLQMAFAFIGRKIIEQMTRARYLTLGKNNETPEKDIVWKINT